jgi:hypothetical protein
LIHVADAFALIPRYAAETYFSMEALVQPGVFCLGGPNFEKKSLHHQNLLRIGFSELEIPHVMNAQCEMSCSNINICGVSEQILARKLVYGGVSGIEASTTVNVTTTTLSIGFTPLFLLIVRYPLTPDCGNLRPDNLFDFLLHQISNTALITGCRTLFNDIRDLVPNNFSTCSQLAMYDRREYAGDCLLNKFKSDWNFLPFRIIGGIINGVKHCLTFVLTSGSQYILKFLPCIDVESVEVSRVKYVYKYGRKQLFHFHPLLTSTQAIKFADDDNNAIQCVRKAEHSSQGIVKPCSSNAVEFSIVLMNRGRIKSRVRRMRGKQGGQLLRRIEWVSFSILSSDSSPPLCLTFIKKDAINVDKSSDLELLPCQDEKIVKTTNVTTTFLHQVFQIERTQMTNKKYDSL